MYAERNASEVIKQFESSSEAGLSEAAAERRLDEYGPNQLEEQKKKGVFGLFMEQLNDPLIYILMAAIAISLFLGEAGDAAIIAAVILLNSIVGVVQEDKARKAIEALQQLSSPRALVLRDGDIVIFGGDLFDNYARDKELLDMEYLQEELSKIEAKAGKYAVFGNHDYGGGAVRIYEQFMNNCGFYVLDNETVFLEKFNIEVIGFDDYLLGQTEVDFYHIQSDNFHLIVTHEPVISKWIEGSGENLTLSEKNKELPSLYS